MKVFIQFDASVSAYEIKGELYTISSWTGVTNVTLLEKVHGEAPRFCLEIDVADQHVESFREQSKVFQAQYSSYVYNMKEIAYRAV